MSWITPAGRPAVVAGREERIRLSPSQCYAVVATTAADRSKVAEEGKTTTAAAKEAGANTTAQVAAGNSTVYHYPFLKDYYTFLALN
jgi:hypothetical protein